MILELKNRTLKFEKASLTILEKGIKSTFKKKNNKTLSETLEHSRYKKIKTKIKEPTKAELQSTLGNYLINKKNINDSEYMFFLNKYGDNDFCHFKLESHLTDKGIYTWVVNNEIKYVGRCTDNFKKRINQGYGKISPKNCYKDGQATNCHLNSEINKLDKIDFYVFPMNTYSTTEIHNLELEILNTSKFDWNIQNNRGNKSSI